MDLTAAIQIVVLSAAGGLIVYAAVVLEDFRRTLRSIDRLARNLDEQVLPLARKANRALDEVNEELVRVEGIVRSVEEVSQRVSSTAEMARHALSSPLVKLAGWSAGMRKAVSTLAHHDEHEQGSGET